VRIEKWVYGGNGIGWANGETHFAGFVLPGELVRVESEKDKRGIQWGKPVKILEASKDRVAPRCKHFGECGGCQYQHAQYDAQLQGKSEILVEQLSRMGRIDMEKAEVEVIAGPEYGYRNRCQFQVDEKSGKLGYLEQGSHSMVPIEECPIASPFLMDSLSKLKALLPRFVSRFELFTNERETQLNILKTGRPLAKRFFADAAKIVPGMDQPHLDYTVGTHVYRVNHKSFFQVNRFLIEALADAVVSGVEGDNVYDLYSGVGLFTLPLAKKTRQVTAVEVGASAHADLVFNLARAGLAARTSCARVEDWLERIREKPDWIVADPPRTGLGKIAVRELMRLKPCGITVVSCNPSTLARDLADLKPAYRIENLKLVDLFPQTHHIETVVRLRRI
jgi:23S rRNA (uracil1939-C5)-methyltransferase